MARCFVLAAVRWFAALCLALILAVALPLAATAQGADPASLQREIDQLQTRIDTFSRILDDPDVMVMPSNLYAEMTGRFVDVPFVPMTQEEFLNISTDFYAFGGIKDGAPGMSLEEYLKRLVRYSRQVRSGLQQEASRLIIKRDDLIYQLEQLGGPPSGNWFGSWALTTTHVGGSPYLVGESFAYPLTVRPGNNGGCTANAGLSRVISCRIVGNHLILETIHPAGGQVNFELDLNGNSVTGKFYGTIGTIPHVDGTVEGYRE
jgi:hypothetical protein